MTTRGRAVAFTVGGGIGALLLAGLAALGWWLYGDPDKEEFR